MFRFTVGLIAALCVGAVANATNFHCSACNGNFQAAYWSGACPLCGQHGVHIDTPTPFPPTPPVPGPNPHPGPQPGGQGLSLGLHLVQGNGVIVNSVVPGSIAHNKFFQNDQLLRYAYIDSFSKQKVKGFIHSINDVETMKSNAGAGNPIAIAVTRPVYGERKFLVTLAGAANVPVTSAFSTTGGSQPQQSAMQRVAGSVVEGSSYAEDLLGGGSGSPVPVQPGPSNGSIPSNQGGSSLIDGL